MARSRDAGTRFARRAYDALHSSRAVTSGVFTDADDMIHRISSALAVAEQLVAIYKDLLMRSQRAHREAAAYTGKAFSTNIASRIKYRAGKRQQQVSFFRKAACYDGQRRMLHDEWRDHVENHIVNYRLLRKKRRINRSARTGSTPRQTVAHQQPRSDCRVTTAKTGESEHAVPHEASRTNPPAVQSSTSSNGGQVGSDRPLKGVEYQRYGRQMIMPEVGLQGQLRLKHVSVLIIGVGGLGCPAASYLAGAGIGRLGLVDDDMVEVSNLHRQILHSTSTVGMKKVASAIQRLRDMNPLVEYTGHEQHLTPEAAISTIEPYHIVLDCTDHPTSRYLISDACVLLGKPLISASALRTDGQLTVLNDPPCPPGDPRGGPCYRCVWPKPPPAESVTGCGDGGILGPVVGTMGVLMAFEAIKMISSGNVKIGQMPDGSNGKPEIPDHKPASMLLFSGYGPRQFQSIKLPGRRPACPTCSEQATISAHSLNSGSLDYAQFCGITSPVNVLRPDERIQARDLAALLRDGNPSQRSRSAARLVDVRESVQFDICHIAGSVNVPFSELMAWRGWEDVAPEVKEILAAQESSSGSGGNADSSTENPPTLTFICRVGNDSQLAVKKLSTFVPLGRKLEIKDVQGGLRAWRTDVDATWPEY